MLSRPPDSPSGATRLRDCPAVQVSYLSTPERGAGHGLRGAVIYRKLSLGSQSDQGERTIERLLSASVTCRLQKQSL
ncbi:MAG: hypothetical protein LC790_06765, partial [Actinobacteria bacterium]|nr:hypothetical protein [Actinomycetota bacterium]